MDKIELLAPAGSFESLIAAINNGADAIYLGGSKFSARAYASNFDNETMMKAVDYAHSYNVKVYVTMNTLLKQNELKEALKYVGYLYEIGVDALIIQDTGLINLCKQIYPEFELHASTQMTIHNGEGALYFTEKGLQRIVLSRELTLNEIKYISKDLGIETEIFVHGALCVCYSGQCLMSSMIGGRSGNRGRCAQPCRMQYTLKGETTGSERKGYLLSPKDTCLIDDMEGLIKSGTSSLKVEGRMKKPEYVAGVTQNYRKSIDKVLNHTKFDLSKGRANLAQLFNREGFAKAYLHKNVGRDMMSYNYPKNTGVYIGKVLDNGEVLLEQDVALGDGIRFAAEDGFTLSKIIIKGKEVKEALKGDKVKLFPANGYKKGNKLYKMSDKKLNDELKDYVKPYKRKISLVCEAEFTLNAPLTLKTTFNGKQYKVFGEIVEYATNKPLTKERVEESLKKSGDIPYKFDKVIFSTFDDGFIRISSINELRRELFEKILKDNVSSHRRKRIAHEEAALSQKNDKILGNIFSCVSKGQLKALMEDDMVENIALDLSFSRQKDTLAKEDLKSVSGKENKNIYLKVPNIIKEEFHRCVNLIDELTPYINGIITSNVGIIRIFKDKLFIIGDYKLNIYNKESAEFYGEDIDIVSLSLEINRKELKEVMKNNNVNVCVNVYGKTELMVSEYCPVGSTFGGVSAKNNCNGACMKEDYTLIDRMNERFRVMCDNNCRSHIMNPLAINLIEELDELASFGISNFRFDFTDESYETTKEILQEIRTGKRTEARKYTNGHYRRGVE